MTSSRVIQLSFLCLLSTSFCLLPASSSASGFITKVDEEGNITVTEASKQFRGMLKCGGVKASLSLDDMADQKPNVMAVLVETDGSKIYPIRLIHEFDEWLENHHSLTDFEIGCLSGDGGIGMIFKSSDLSKEDSFIQLDSSGRLFSKFNQTGFRLLRNENVPK